MTQCKKIHEYMKKYGSITSLDAFRDIGCTRLSARIHDLREQGVKIDSKMVEVPTRDGKTTVSSYFLAEDNDG